MFVPVRSSDRHQDSKLASLKSSLPGKNTIGFFTVVYLVTWPVTASEAGGDLALIQTSGFLI